MKRVEKWNEFFILWENPIKNRRVNEKCHECLSLNWTKIWVREEKSRRIFFLLKKNSQEITNCQTVYCQF